jgi:HEPN domain-containing protein
MTPDDLRANACRAWLEKASVDLDSARALIDADIASSALFHCQQAVEKSFKAFLTWHGVPFRRVHDLEETGAYAFPSNPP